MLTVEEMEAIVDETMDALPPLFQLRIQNLVIVVEEWPDRETLRMAGLHDRRELLGFYHGVPLTQRTTDYGLVPPDKISIYRRPILADSRTPEEARENVRHTLRHELAHYFGISDDRLDELGAY